MTQKRTRSFPVALSALLIAGVLLQAWLGSRGGIGGDQYVLLDLGLDYLEKEELSAVGKGMSGGGFIPGSLLQLLIGIPFSLWRDYRSPVVLLGILHLAAGLVSALTVRSAAGERASLLFVTLWWLSPWRLFHSGFLWEPSYVFLPAALHLWACWSLRERGGAFASAVLAAALMAAFQLHGSFLFLVILTAFLLAARRIRIQWQGGLLGAAAGGLTLIPALTALLEGNLPTPAPTKSFVGYGFATVVPVLKGFAYWFRLGSLDIGRRLKETVFFESGGVEAMPGGILLQGGAWLLAAAGIASILLAVAATWWCFLGKGRSGGQGEGRQWLRAYGLCALGAVLLASGLSPVTIQGWHVLIALPAACLPVALWIDGVWDGAGRGLRLAVLLLLVLRLPVIGAAGYGHPMYRPDPDVAERLQARQQTLLPPHLRPPQ